MQYIDLNGFFAVETKRPYNDIHKGVSCNPGYNHNEKLT
jgi:hypothetical protein